jgi:hypothetical protein
VDRARGGTPRLIWAVHNRSDGQGRARAYNGGACAGEVTRAAARSGDSPALPLGGAPGHQNDHRLAHFEAGLRAHVLGNLKETLVLRRRLAPEGGGATAPASLRARR